MEDLLARFSHLGERIFDSLDDKSLLNCKKTCRTWNSFIENQKFSWIRIIKKEVKKSNKKYTECPRIWKKMFLKSSTNSVKTFAKKLLGTCKNYDSKGFTPLHFIVDDDLGYLNQAIVHEIFKNIFEVEENKNPKDDWDNTPLHFACKDPRKIAICKLILEYIEDKNPPNKSGITPIFYAAGSGNLGYFELFYKYSKEINPKMEEEYGYTVTPLHIAAQKGYLTLCEFIIERISEKSPRDKNGETPLHYAVKSNHPEVFHLLLKNSKDKNPKDFRGNTIFQTALQDGDLATFKMIVKEMEEICPKTIDGQNLVKIALQTENNAGETPFQYAEFLYLTDIQYYPIMEYIKEKLDEGVKNREAKKRKVK